MTKEIATLGAGCFWCVEAVFQDLKGVTSVTPGYTGGQLENPTYEDVCTGLTGHAEVAQIEFDPQDISFAEILEVFWLSHDPTTLNRQGNDVGSQYRSVIFYSSEEQKETALASKKEIEARGIYDNPIVTEIAELGKFYIAEDYHHNYFKNNANQAYCQAVINPKVLKFRKMFADKLKN